uniref:ARAD1C43274p n=1 Tax=Blastobotrys adeninivorans TaxID=409370 RepID=A0A060T9C4_BLAAD
MAIDVPALSIQPSALDVINDVETGTVAQDSIWVSWVPFEAGSKTRHETFNVYSQQGQLTLRNVENSGISVDYNKTKSMKIAYDKEEFTMKFPTRVFAKYGNKHDLSTVDISAHGQLLVVGDTHGAIDILDAKDGTLRRRLSGHYMDVTKVGFFPSGEVVLSCGLDFQLKIWSAVDGSNPRTFLGHTRGVTDFAMIGRGRNFVSSSLDGTARLWETGSGKCIHTFSIGESINALSLLHSGSDGDAKSELEFETSGKTIVAGSDRGIHLFDLRARNTASSGAIGDSEGNLTSLATVNEHTYAYGTDKGSFSVVDIRSGVLQAGKKRETSITSLAVRKDQLIVATGDGTPFAVGLSDMNNPPISFYGGDDNSVTATVAGEGGIVFAGKRGSLRMY